MRPTHSIRILPLLALTAAVLLAHDALLRTAPATIDPALPNRAQPFSTRAIEPPPTALEQAPATTAAIETAVAIQAAATAVAAPPPSGEARDTARRHTPSSRRAPDPANSRSLSGKLTRAVTQSADDAMPSMTSVESPEPAPPTGTPASLATLATPAPAAPAHGLHAAAFKVAAPVRLLYDVHADLRGLALDAQGQLLWRHDDDSYDARLDLTLPLVGTRSQTSVGHITAAGLAPTRFSDKARSELAAHFERAPDGVGGKVIFSANTPTAVLLAGAQDRLSVFLQLGAMLAGAPDSYRSGTTISLQIVGPRDADIWQFTVGDMEQLHLPIGDLDAVKLTRNPRREFDSKVEMWLAPSLGYLPVRIRLTQANGDSFDQRLRASESP